MRIAAHQAIGVFPPRPATAPRHFSAKERTGRVEAIAMTTTTNIGSVKWTCATKPSTECQPFITAAERRSGIAQMPKTASTSPKKWSISTRKLCPSPPVSFAVRCWRRCAAAVILAARNVWRMARTKTTVATRLTGSSSTRWTRSCQSVIPASPV